MFTISDQVAQARHSRNQNYPPFYLNITCKTETKKKYTNRLDNAGIKFQTTTQQNI